MKKLLKLIALVMGVLMMMACNPEEGSNDYVNETPTEVNPINVGEDGNSDGNNEGGDNNTSGNDETEGETPTENENHILFTRSTTTPRYFTLDCDSITGTWFNVNGLYCASKGVVVVVYEKTYTIETAQTKSMITFDSKEKTITIDSKVITSDCYTLDIDVYYDIETQYFYVEW